MTDRDFKIEFETLVKEIVVPIFQGLGCKKNGNNFYREINGIGQAILGANKALQDKFMDILGCYKGTAKPSPAAPAGGVQSTFYKIFDKTISGIVAGVKFIFQVPSAILGYICKFKTNIVQYISSLFALKKLKKYRRMMENGQSLSLAQLRKYKASWGFLSSIKNGLSSVGNAVGGAIKSVGNGLNYVGGALWNVALNVIGPFFKEHFETIKAAMIAIRDSFFGEDSFVGKLVSCANKLSSSVWVAIKDFFGKLKERYLRYTGISGIGLPYVALLWN